MENENVDKCVALESVAKQDNGKRDSMIGSSITRMCAHVYAHTALWETMHNYTASHMCMSNAMLQLWSYISYVL